jgi:hypothetical protein
MLLPRGWYPRGAVFGLGGDVREAAGLWSGLPRPVRATYEAGPTGYGLARELAARGVQCVVAAPGKIPRAGVGWPGLSRDAQRCIADGGTPRACIEEYPAEP